jgi:hypothetical protein
MKILIFLETLDFYIHLKGDGALWKQNLDCRTCWKCILLIPIYISTNY